VRHIGHHRPAQALLLLQFAGHRVELARQVADLVLCLHLDSVAQVALADASGAILDNAQGSQHGAREKQPEADGHCAGQQPSVEDRGAEPLLICRLLWPAAGEHITYGLASDLNRPSAGEFLGAQRRSVPVGRRIGQNGAIGICYQHATYASPGIALHVAAARRVPHHAPPSEGAVDPLPAALCRIVFLEGRHERLQTPAHPFADIVRETARR